MIVLKQQITYEPNLTIIRHQYRPPIFYETHKDLYKGWKESFKYPKNLSINDMDWLLINVFKPKLPILLNDEIFSKVGKTYYAGNWNEIYDKLMSWTTNNLGIQKGKRIINKDWEWGYNLANEKIFPLFNALMILSNEISPEAIEDWEDILIYAYNFPTDFSQWIKRIEQQGMWIPFPKRIRVKPKTYTEQPFEPFEPKPEPPKAPEPEPQKAGFDFGKILPILIGVGAIYFIIKR
jgi:hypothetical protein